jgi:hypothetical protein
MEIKLSFHAIVATVHGTVLNFFTTVLTADTDSLFKNCEDTLREKTRDMILRCAYQRHEKIQFQPPTVYHHNISEILSQPIRLDTGTGSTYRYCIH